MVIAEEIILFSSAILTKTIINLNSLLFIKMVLRKEFFRRVKQYYRFSQSEITGIIASVFILGIIFSFRDWGNQQFDLTIGLTHLFLVFLIAAISIIFRITIQKFVGLSRGYNPEFKIWWVGLFLSLILALVSNGRLTLVLMGTVFSTLMIKLRLGEFRYGFSLLDNAIIAFWGILGSLIIASLFGIGLYFFPESYIFYKGMLLNLIMAFCSLLPVHQLEGLNIFFGSRLIYYIGFILTAIIALILITQTKIGLTFLVIASVIAAFILYLVSSEK